MVCVWMSHHRSVWYLSSGCRVPGERSGSIGIYSNNMQKQIIQGQAHTLKKTVYTIGYISRPPSKRTNTLAARGHRRFPESTSFEKKNRQVATTNCWMVGFVGKRLLLSRC